MHEAIGSVRVDLLGGTLDFNPINLILPKVVTLNLATSLKARVQLEDIDYPGIEIHSADYNSVSRYLHKDITDENLSSGFFGQLQFIVEILKFFGATSNLSVRLTSGSPTGAGLGGSSAMGVTLYKALCSRYDKPLNREEAVRTVMGIESRILDSGPAGYQDYYPALYGGVLALHSQLNGVQVEQLFSADAKQFIESHMTLVYSGETRHSGMNNWEVYKGFFDRSPQIRNGLGEIARLAQTAYQALKAGEYSSMLDLIAQEGEQRANLFPGLVSASMKACKQEIAQALGAKARLGLKVCGAGGGGCFLLVHDPKSSTEVERVIKQHGMRKLPLEVEPPLQFSSSSSGIGKAEAPNKNNMSFLAP